jgi:branched-chain amino acid transport system substrate-binding protein
MSCFLLPAAVLVLLLGVSSPSATASSTKATPAPIKLGLICSCSSAFGASVVTQVDVYKVAINHFNALGGVKGHRIQIIEKDDAASPSTSVSDVEQLISDHVAAISDWSFVDFAWASTVGKSGIPIVGGNISDATFNTYPDFYPQGQTLNSVTYSTVLSARQAGAKSLAILYCSEAPTCLQSAQEDKTVAQTLHMKVAYEAQASSTEPNYTAQCLAAQQAKAQAVILLYGPTTAVTISGNCATQGYYPIYDMEGGAINFSLFKGSPGIKKHLVGPFTDIPSVSPSAIVRGMNADINGAYHGLEKEPAWTEESSSAWPAAKLLVAAAGAGGLTKSRAPSAGIIVKGLESMKKQTLGGFAPPLTFQAGKPHTVDCWFTAELLNGKAQMANGGRITCHKS